jgi:hypothetical protein
MTPNNWTLNAYTAGTWTDLVPAVSAPTVIKSISISVGANPASVSIRLANGAGSRALLVPSSSVVANAGYSADLSAVTLVVGDKLQINCSAAAVEFAAFGAQ